MKLRYIAGSLAALLVVLAVSAVACGDDEGGDDGDGDTTSEIRIEKGLTVANIGVFRGGAGEESAGDDVATDGAAAPLAPATGENAAGDAAYDIGIGREGIAGYPAQAVQTGAGLTVQGYGTATADADSARIEFYFGRYNEEPKPIPVPEPGSPDGQSSSGGSDGDIRADELQEVSPITEEDLQPVIAALQAAGAADVEFVGQGYYDPYWASASLRATVSNLDAVEAVVNAGNEAAAGLEGISLQSSNAMYTISDCSALEQAALEAAIEDAGDNAQTFAAALGVTAGDIVGASNYSYFTDDGTCGSYWGYYPVEDIGFVGGPTEVSVYAQVSITYAMQ